jgi:hypothetical protein
MSGPLICTTCDAVFDSLPEGAVCINEGRVSVFLIDGVVHNLKKVIVRRNKNDGESAEEKE